MSCDDASPRNKGAKVDLSPERLAVSSTDKGEHVAAVGCHATGQCHQVGQSGIGQLEGIAPRSDRMSQNRRLRAAQLGDKDRNLWLAEKLAVEQAVGDAFFRLADRQTTQRHGAEQRIVDDAAFRNSRFQREFRALEDGHANNIARTQYVVLLDNLILRRRSGAFLARRLVLRRHRARSHNQEQSDRELPKRVACHLFLQQTRHVT
jgi:hypothetical protein